MNPEVEQEFLEALEVWAREWELALQRVLEGQEGELNLVDGKSYRQVKFNPNHDARGRFSSGAGSGLSRYYGDPVLFVENATDEDVADIYRVPGYTTRVELNRVVHGFPERDVTVALLDENGNTVARMTREFDSNKKSVYHDTFIITDSRLQGEGIAAALNARAEERYKEMGFTKVTLMADIDVGKYAWARQGYDIKASKRTNFLEEQTGYLRAVLREANPGMSKEAAQKRAEKLMAGKTHAWEVAALDDGKKYSWKTNSKSGEGHLGKAVMLKGNWWEAEKILVDDGVGYQLGKSYYKAKGAIK